MKYTKIYSMIIEMMTLQHVNKSKLPDWELEELDNIWIATNGLEAFRYMNNTILILY